MNKITKIILLVFLFFIIIISGYFVFIFKYYNLDRYYASVDRSCNVDSDCEIKDVHNCCGYSPACINKDAETDPDYVKKACLFQRKVSVCGWVSLNGCVCVENRCKDANILS
jgi:hypothetical protein